MARPGSPSLLAGLLALVLLAPGCHSNPASPSSPASTPASTPSSRVAAVLVVRRAAFRLPFAVQREVALPVGSRVYLLGGLNGSGVSTSTVLSVDVARGRARIAGHVVQPFHDAAGAVIGSRLFVFAGGTGQVSSMVQSFDPAAGASKTEGATPRPLSDLGAVQVGGVVYLVGGYDGVAPQRIVYSTTDGVRFHQAASMPVGLRYPAVSTWGSKVVIAGGETSTGLSRKILLFDPGSGTVRTIGRLPSALAHASAFELGGIVYVVGGADAGGTSLRQIVAVDPRTGDVRAAGRLPAAVADAAAVVTGGQAWIFGGARASAVDDVLVASLSSG